MSEIMRDARSLSNKLQGIDVAKKDLIRLNKAIALGKPGQLERVTASVERQWGRVADARMMLIRKQINDKKTK